MKDTQNIIKTSRLSLIAATEPLILNLLGGKLRFETEYGIKVAYQFNEFPGSVEYALEYCRNNNGDVEWGAYLFVIDELKVLAGFGGYKGEPNTFGEVEIGYSVSPQFRNRGFATEAAKGLTNYAFLDSRVKKVIAHTLAEENPSSNLLKKLGFVFTIAFEDSEDGQIWRWERKRQDADAGKTS
ncbi:MAG: GNAT family N-acetyltransferase [Ignavibacteriaceae bacterium]|nr:GNAT family N-acetyltransferase [Ignavibacteriaceae bacterium]